MADETLDTLIVKIMSKLYPPDGSAVELRELVSMLPLLLFKERAAWEEKMDALASDTPSHQNHPSPNPVCKVESLEDNHVAAIETAVVPSTREGKILQTEDSVFQEEQDNLKARVAMLEAQLAEAMDAVAAKDTQNGQLKNEIEQLCNQGRNLQEEMRQLHADKRQLLSSLTLSNSVALTEAGKRHAQTQEIPSECKHLMQWLRKRLISIYNKACVIVSVQPILAKAMVMDQAFSAANQKKRSQLETSMLHLAGLPSSLVELQRQLKLFLTTVRILNGMRRRHH